MKSLKSLLKTMSFLSLLVIGQYTYANSSISTTTQANAKLQAVCTIATTNMSFGTLTVNTEATATSNVSVTCTKGSSYTIGFNYSNPGGSHLVGTNFADNLPYIVEILQTGGFLTLSNITGVGNGTVQTYGLEGFILQSESESAPRLVPYVTPDNYTDSITATISY